MTTRHKLQAGQTTVGGRRGWILLDLTNGDIVGGDCPEYTRSRAEMYARCEKLYGPESPWFGRRVHGGYSIQVTP